jgi:predicted nucleic acid-binding protein
MDSGGYHVIPVTSALIRRAADLCNMRPLKGYDAVQLAAALMYRDDARAFDAQTAASSSAILGDPIFLTEDKRLAAAASAEGFIVDSPLSHP